MNEKWKIKDLICIKSSKMPRRVAEYCINAKITSSASFLEIFDNPAFGNLPEENHGRAAIDRGVEMISFDGFDEGNIKT